MLEIKVLAPVIQTFDVVIFQHANIGKDNNTITKMHVYEPIHIFQVLCK